MTSELTVLNGMVDEDFEASLRRHHEWGLKWLDLRDSLFGRNVADLDVDTAERVRGAIDTSGGLSVYCLSSSLMFDDIEKGHEHFATHHLNKLDALCKTADILKPRLVRLIAATYKSRVPGRSSIPLVRRDHSWVLDAYRRAIDRLAEAGHMVTIENEAPDCILAQPDEVLEFFDAIDRRDAVGFTWDIQNQWGCGVFPTVRHYEELKPLIQYVHVKGGRYDDPTTLTLKWNVALQDANWPVREIIERVAADDVSPVICINMPFHGQRVDGYDYSDVTKRDIDFMRTLKGVV